MTAIQKLAANFTEVEVDDEIILMRLDNGDLFTLVDTAAATWRLIDGRRDHRALVEALAADYAAGEQEIAQDVSQLLDQLREAGFVAGE